MCFICTAAYSCSFVVHFVCLKMCSFFCELCSFGLLHRVEVQCSDSQGGRSASIFRVAELFQIGCRSNKEEGNVAVIYSDLKCLRQSQTRKVGGKRYDCPEPKGTKIFSHPEGCRNVIKLNHHMTQKPKIRFFVLSKTTAKT